MMPRWTNRHLLQVLSIRQCSTGTVAAGVNSCKPRHRYPLWFALAGAGGAAGLAVASRRDGLALTLARADSQFRPGLASVLPHSVFVWLYSASRSIYLSMLASTGVTAVPHDYPCPCTALGMTFRSDLGNAAGLDKDGRLLEFNFALGAGFAVVGTVLSEPHTGNVFRMLGGLWPCNAWTPLPSSGGALNSLGLPSYGVNEALRNIEAFRTKHGIQPAHSGEERSLDSCFPIGVSIMGHPAHDEKRKLEGVLDCVRKAAPLADFIEINESCPNVKHGGDAGGLTDRLRAVVAVRDELQSTLLRRVPILVKLGDVGDAEATIRFLAELGIDGLVAVNTQRDYQSFSLPDGDRKLLDYYTSQYGGGLSGRPIKQRALEQARAASMAVRNQGRRGKFVVVHVGGLEDAEDIRNSRSAGPELRQWYTGFMHGLADSKCAPCDLYRSVTQA